MIELSLFGILLFTLGSAVVLVLVLVALTSVTYIAMTLITAMRAEQGPRPLSPAIERWARLLGLSTAILGAGLALAGLRVGSPGSGGEIIPTLTVIIAGAAAIGSSTACGLLTLGRGARQLQASRDARARIIARQAQASARRLAAENRRRLDGEDLRDEEAEAFAALDRLRAALKQLAEARAAIADQRQGSDPQSEIAAEYRRAGDALEMKIELGHKVLGAAEAAAFRLACHGPLRRLARRRPRESLSGIERLDGPALDQAAAAISAFLDEIGEARRALDALLYRRPASVKAGTDEDPWTLAEKDLASLAAAFGAVRARVDVRRARRAAEATLAEVADAATAVSASGKGVAADQAEIEQLATDVARAEAAVVMATPVESNAGPIMAALGRCTAALDRTDAASLDELLHALRAIV